MPTTTPSKEDAELRGCIETLAQAIRVKDVNALMAHYSPDILTFDVQPPLQVQGDAYRKNFERWFASMEGPIDYQMQDLRIATSGGRAGGNFPRCGGGYSKTGRKNERS